MKDKIFKYYISLWLLLCAATTGHAQQDTLCGFDAVFNGMLQQNPNLLNQILSANSSQNNSNNPDEYVIPIVVHIIHNNGNENISDAQVLNGIDILNETFHGDFDPAHRDTKIRFRLAQTDPNGCVTNGILRIQSPLTPCLL